MPDYAQRLKYKIEQGNLLSVIFPIPHTPRGAYLTFHGEKTMSGQDLEDAQNAVETGYRILLQQFKRHAIKLEDQSLEDNVAFFVSDSFREVQP
jgi:hypothetical protein